jgi:hypothetical protein
LTDHAYRIITTSLAPDQNGTGAGIGMNNGTHNALQQ